MRLWHDQYHGRLRLKKAFLKVKKDPFSSSDVKSLYMLRIEVYPQSKAEDEEDEKGEKKPKLKDEKDTEPNTYFSLKLKKNGKLIKEETCLLDGEGKLRIVTGTDAYFIILRSFKKTQIVRGISKEDDVNKKEEKFEGENPYFESDVEYVKAEQLNAKAENKGINFLLKYNHQSIISLPPNQEKLFEQISERLKEQKILHELINLYSQYQDGRQIRVMSHNKKLKDIKNLVGEEIQKD